MISGQFVPHHKKFLGIFLIGSPLMSPRYNGNKLKVGTEYRFENLPRQ
jgi:hypothetical protein